MMMAGDDHQSGVVADDDGGVKQQLRLLGDEDDGVDVAKPVAKSTAVAADVTMDDSKNVLDPVVVSRDDDATMRRFVHRVRAVRIIFVLSGIAVIVAGE
jgi:hypothetical protein